MGDENKAMADREAPDRTIEMVPRPGKGVEEESVAVPKRKRSKKLRCCMWCCGIAIVILILLAIVIVILIFTVFELKKPSFSVTSIALKHVNLQVPKFSDPNFIFTAEVDTNATIHNPNAGGFKYGNFSAQIFYHSDQVVVVRVAAGELKAHSNDNIFIPLQLSLSTNELLNGNLTKDLIDDKMLPLVSEVNISGTVEILFVKIHNVRVYSVCDLNYYLNETYSIQCQFDTKI